MANVLYKDINELVKKANVSGEEKLPVSKDEFITPNQIAGIAGSIKYGTTEYWNSRIGYIPKAGEIVVYSDYKTVEQGGETKLIPGIKIGSGNAYVQDLVFSDAGADTTILETHIADNIRHITAQERAFWDGKLNVDDNNEVEDEALIFIRN
jgi:hypothetical protein